MSHNKRVIDTKTLISTWMDIIITKGGGSTNRFPRGWISSSQRVGEVPTGFHVDIWIRQVLNFSNAATCQNTTNDVFFTNSPSIQISNFLTFLNSEVTFVTFP
jgi:hypothetical protein